MSQSEFPKGQNDALKLHILFIQNQLINQKLNIVYLCIHTIYILYWENIPIWVRRVILGHINKWQWSILVSFSVDGLIHYLLQL